MEGDDKYRIEAFDEWAAAKANQEALDKEAQRQARPAPTTRNGALDGHAASTHPGIQAAHGHLSTHPRIHASNPANPANPATQPSKSP